MIGYGDENHEMPSDSTEVIKAKMLQVLKSEREKEWSLPELFFKTGILGTDDNYNQALEKLVDANVVIMTPEKKIKYVGALTEKDASEFD